MKIELSLGNVALRIAGKAKTAQAEALAGIAAGSLAYRAGASKAFGAKAPFKRDAAFSDGLAKHVEACLTEVLKPYFDDVSIETEAYVPKPSSTSKALQSAHDVLKSTGLDEDALKKAFPSLYEAKPEVAETAPEQLKAA